MHKFLRAAGFSMYTKKKDIEKLLDLLERQPSMTRCVQVDEESNVCEMRTEVAPGLGISIIGELNEEGNFEREFYFPYQEVLLPIKKSQKQIQKAKVAAKNRNSLIEAAKNGDEDAMESLTIEDIDLYSQISRRAMKEDLYSIIDSCFMPCGVECDQYSVIGEIEEVEKIRNIYTKEEIYRMKIESHDLEFVVCINSKDLLGEPQPGRRFKGQIWMQGTLKLEDIIRKQGIK